MKNDINNPLKLESYKSMGVWSCSREFNFDGEYVDLSVAKELQEENERLKQEVKYVYGEIDDTTKEELYLDIQALQSKLTKQTELMDRMASELTDYQFSFFQAGMLIDSERLEKILTEYTKLKEGE